MREYCYQCQFPKSTCVCAAVFPLKNDTNVVILQHPKEATHAKNTVKLLALCLQNIFVFKGVDRDDFKPAMQFIKQHHCVVVYPCENSVSIQDLSINVDTPLDTIILLDGSWRQAYAIWSANEWLHTLPVLKLSPCNAKTDYVIRSAPFEHSMSTLEAVAQTLEQIENMTTDSLLRLQKKFVEQWLEYVPSKQKKASD